MMFCAIVGGDVGMMWRDHGGGVGKAHVGWTVSAFFSLLSLERETMYDMCEVGKYIETAARGG